MKAKLILVLIVSVLVATGIVVLSDESDAGSNATANVFADVGGSMVEMEGTGNTVRDILIDAAASGGYKIDVGPVSIKTFNGENAPEGKTWTVQQWLPPRGWTVINLSKNPEADLEDGTSYYIHLSDRIVDDRLNVSYSKPSHEPESTGYFFIQFKEDINDNEEVRNLATEEQRAEGFWIYGKGSNAAWAFQDACSRFGLSLNMSNGVKDGIENLDYVGWLNSFLNLQDKNMGPEKWKYWSQFHYSGKWNYSETLGHYDPAVVKYYAFIRRVTAENDVQNQSGAFPSVSPSSIPKGCMENGCTVTFRDGNGLIVQSDNVPYFGTANPPSSATKSPSGNTTYEFTGWEGNYRNVVSDCTVKAVFKEIKADIKVTGVEIDSYKEELQVGKTFRFGSKVTPSDALNPAVSWKSGNPSVATVGSDGVVTAVSEGSALITVTTEDGGKTASRTVKVVKEVSQEGSKEVAATGVEILEVTETARVGKTVDLDAKVLPSNSTYKGVTWSTSDKDIATVSPDGKVLGVSAGKVTITVTSNDGGFTDTVEIEVMPKGAVTELDMTDSKSLMTVGGEFTFKAVAGPEDASDRNVTWSVSEGGVLSVDKSGKVSALKAGDAAVTASAGKLTVTCRVHVVEDLGEADSLDVSTGKPRADAEVKLETDHMAALIDKGNGCDVKTDNGSISISKEVLVKYRDEGIDLTFSIASGDDLTDAQKDIVKDSTVYQFQIGGSDVPDLGGKVSVTVEYELPPGSTAGDVRVYHIDWRGTLEEMTSEFDPATGELTFETDHFSMYFATTEDLLGTGPAEPAEETEGSDDNAGGGSVMWIAAAAAVVLVAVAAFFLLRSRKG